MELFQFLSLFLFMFLFRCQLTEPDISRFCKRVFHCFLLTCSPLQKLNESYPKWQILQLLHLLFSFLFFPLCLSLSRFFLYLICILSSITYSFLFSFNFNIFEYKSSLISPFFSFFIHSHSFHESFHIFQFHFFIYSLNFCSF